MSRRGRAGGAAFVGGGGGLGGTNRATTLFGETAEEFIAEGEALEEEKDTDLNGMLKGHVGPLSTWGS